MRNTDPKKFTSDSICYKHLFLLWRCHCSYNFSFIPAIPSCVTFTLQQLLLFVCFNSLRWVTLMLVRIKKTHYWSDKSWLRVQCITQQILKRWPNATKIPLMVTCTWYIEQQRLEQCFWCLGPLPLCDRWHYSSTKNPCQLDKSLLFLSSMGNTALQKHNSSTMSLLLPCYRAWN